MPETPVPAAYTRHAHATAMVDAEPRALFDHLDDPRRLGSHMEKPSWRTGGASMRYAFDAGMGRRLGAEIRMDGQVLGVQLHLAEVVTERTPPGRKVWQTVGEPRLVVIAGYRMGFEITASGPRSALRLFIDYDAPPWRPKWLSNLLADWYAQWCVDRMADDARRYFAPSPRRATQ
jgi:hypothetical protein